jgi:predicted dehydrogenase
VIDLLLDCLGWPEVTRVSGHVSSMLGKTPALTGDWRPADPEGVFDVEDFAAGQVTTAAGTTMQLAISWAGHGISPGKPDEQGYAWSGSAGAASLFPGSVRIAGREPIEVPEDGFVRRIRAMLREFARRVRTDDARPDDAEHALAVMSVIDAIYRSSTLDAEVRVGAGYVA